MGTLIKDEQLQPRGYQQISGAPSVTSLTVPRNARYALIQVLDQNVRFRDDGEDPTETEGVRLTAGEWFYYNGELGQLRLIEEAPSAEINILYYS